MSALMGVNTGDPRQSGDKTGRESQLPNKGDIQGHRGPWRPGDTRGGHLVCWGEGRAVHKSDKGSVGGARPLGFPSLLFPTPHGGRQNLPRRCDEDHLPQPSSETCMLLTSGIRMFLSGGVFAFSVGHNVTEPCSIGDTFELMKRRPGNCPAVPGTRGLRMQCEPPAACPSSFVTPVAGCPRRQGHRATQSASQGLAWGKHAGSLLSRLHVDVPLEPEDRQLCCPSPLSPSSLLSPHKWVL